MKWFLLPVELIQLRNPSMEAGWIERENLLCRGMVYIFAVILMVALPGFLYLDSLRVQFDLHFALWHRLGGSVFYACLAAMIRWDVCRNYRFGFAVYKILFMIGALYVSAFQTQLMMQNPLVPRLYSQAILVGTIGVLNVGLRTSLMLSSLHTLILLIIGISHLSTWTTDTRFVTDLSYQMIAVLLVYLLTSRYSLAVKLHISNSIREEAALNRADHAYSQLTKLVLPHVVTKINNGFHIEDTMPVGSDEAFVICFDIVGSSQIDHRHFYRQLEAFQARCFEVMNENYDPKTMEGEAYRIKELGDGFLCSVGFPLKTPRGENAGALVHRLSLRFLALFDETMASLQYHKPIVGGIGIAYGPIEGYFPSSGPRQYDLRDRSIILATRYQELRKIILVQETQTQHAIIVSRSVHQHLPDHLRSFYRRVKLDGIRVRDDLNADEVYIALIAPRKSHEDRTAA